jgi:hypothetical protein
LAVFHLLGNSSVNLFAGGKNINKFSFKSNCRAKIIDFNMRKTHFVKSGVLFFDAARNASV